MPLVRFSGKIYPLVITVNSAKQIGINWGHSDLGFPIQVTATIINSVVEAVCDVARFEDAHLSVLLSRTRNLVEGFTDTVAFATGIALRVDFDAVTKPDGTKLDIVSHDQYLGELCTAFTFPPKNSAENKEFENILEIILQEPELMGSLTDLSHTLRDFHVTPTNCARVLDTLRKAVSPTAKNKEEGWRTLQEALNIDGKYMTWVSVYSSGTRHGDRTTDIPEPIVREIRIRTWNVTNRFLEFRKAGSVRLDPTKFKLLTHDPSIAFPKF